MIYILDYSVFFMTIMTLLVGLVLGLWMFYTIKGIPRLKSYTYRDIKQCAFCLHVFIHIQQQVIARCPCCQSYLDEVNHEAA